jgi:hypothetical protein
MTVDCVPPLKFTTQSPTEATDGGDEGRASDPKSLTFLNGNWQFPLAGVGVAGTGTITRLSPNVAVSLRFPAGIQGKRGPNFLFRLLPSTCFAKKPLALPSGRARCVLHHRAECSQPLTRVLTRFLEMLKKSGKNGNSRSRIRSPCSSSRARSSRGRAAFTRRRGARGLFP